MKIFGMWLLIGFIVHKYYLLKDDMKLFNEYREGKYDLGAYVRGFVLTLLLWPIAIINNEFRGK